MIWLCRVCGLQFPHSQRTAFLSHLPGCVERNADLVDSRRPRQPFTGDPELASFARAEGDVYNRRPGTRKQPR